MSSEEGDREDCCVTWQVIVEHDTVDAGHTPGCAVTCDAVVAEEKEGRKKRELDVAAFTIEAPITGNGRTYGGSRRDCRAKRGHLLGPGAATGTSTVSKAGHRPSYGRHYHIHLYALLHHRSQRCTSCTGGLNTYHFDHFPLPTSA